MNDRIAVAMICDNNYILPTLVALTSIIINKKAETLLDIYIITTDVSEESAVVFGRYSSDTVRIIVKNETTHHLQSLHIYDEKSHCVASTAALLKFQLPTIIPEYDKLLYLDGDIIVREDLIDLYNTDIGDRFLAAVIDSESIYYKQTYVTKVKDYFNSGVMLFHLRKMREEDITVRLLQAKRELNDSSVMDQNVLNVVFDEKFLALPIRYNMPYASLVRSKSKYTIDQINDVYGTNYVSLLEMVNDAAIVHYSSKDKPWLFASVLLSDEWYDYYLRMKELYPHILPNHRIYPLKRLDGHNNLPMVTVIIPAFNVEEYINESMDSIINQTLTNLEIICVNDGSQDRTLEILNEYARKDSRVLVIDQQNQGQSVARNSGLNHATGEYIYFFDSDDVLLENALENLYAHAKRYNAQNVLFDGITIFANQALEKTQSHYRNMYQRVRSYHGVYKGEELYTLMVKNGDYKVSPCLQFFERRYLEENNITFKEGIIHEDNYFSLQAMLLCQRVCHLRLNLFYRRIRDNSTMTRKHEYKNYRDLYACFIEMLRYAILHQDTISERAMFTVQSQLVKMYRKIYCLYHTLPQGDKHQPRFLDATLHAISEIVYSPFLFRQEEEKNHKKELDSIQKLGQEAERKYRKELDSIQKLYQEAERNHRNELNLINKQLAKETNRGSTLQSELDCLRRSKSFILGRALTFFPRKLKAVYMCLKRNGFKYTVRYIIQRIRQD